MLKRSCRVVGVFAILSTLAFAGSASAQMYLGQRFERGLMSEAGLMTGYPYQGYGTGQFFYHPYQGQSMGYGESMLQSPIGLRGFGRGVPFGRGGRITYQQPGFGNYYQQPGTIVNRPRYDQQLQPTSYAAPVVQRYQIPAEYAGTPAGYVINYGGRNYLSGSDGTMTPYNGPVAPR